MPRSKMQDRRDRVSILALRDDAGPPFPLGGPPLAEEDSGDETSDDEFDDESEFGEDPDEERNFQGAFGERKDGIGGSNPFLPNGATGSSRESLTMDNPFASQATASASTTLSTSFTTSSPSSTSLDLIVPTATGAASSKSPPSDASHPTVAHNTTAIVMASLLTVSAVAAIGYLLYRYSKPLKARFTSCLAWRRKQLPKEEEGTNAESTVPDMSEKKSFFKSDLKPGHGTTASSPRNVAPAYLKPGGVVSYGPTASVRQPSYGGGPSQDDNPDNPFSDHARTLSLSDTHTLPHATVRPGNKGLGMPADVQNTANDTYAFDFNLDDYHNPATDYHHPPTGLTLNPPTIVNGVSTKTEERVPTRPLVPPPITLKSGISYDTELPPETPRSQFQPRMRQSVTPSESVSNVPDSPLPFPAGLMPPNSRWSQNSSSVWTKAVEDRSGSQLGSDNPTTPALPSQTALSVGSSSASLSSVSSHGSKNQNLRKSVSRKGLPARIRHSSGAAGSV